MWRSSGTKPSWARDAARWRPHEQPPYPDWSRRPSRPDAASAHRFGGFFQPGNLLVQPDPCTWTSPSAITPGAGQARRQAGLAPNLRHRRPIAAPLPRVFSATTWPDRQLRRDLPDLPGPAHPVRAAGQHAAGARRRVGPRRSHGDQLLLEVGTGAQPVDQRPAGDLHGVRGPAQPAGRLELQHAGCHRPHQPGALGLLPGGGSGRPAGPVPVHRDQLLQRQQPWPRRHPERQPGRERDLHRGQRREWRQPAAQRGHPGRGHADHDAAVRAGAVPAAGHADAGGQLQRDRNSATRPTRSARTPTSAA